MADWQRNKKNPKERIEICFAWIANDIYVYLCETWWKEHTLLKNNVHWNLEKYNRYKLKEHKMRWREIDWYTER